MTERASGLGLDPDAAIGLLTAADLVHLGVSTRVQAAAIAERAGRLPPRATSDR
jgi:hypothetical protein